MPYGQHSARSVPLPPDWPAIRARILTRDGHACQWHTNGYLCLAPANEVDHIGDPRDHSDRNLRALCAPHHRRRSAQQGGQAAAARRKPRNRPTEPHPGLTSNDDRA